jgi:hypothetical protein
MSSGSSRNLRATGFVTAFLDFDAAWFWRILGESRSNTGCPALRQAQEEHHKSRTFQQELEKLCSDVGITIDDLELL